MLVLHRAERQIEHARISDLPSFLRAGVRLVLNDTKVLHARLLGHRTATGGDWEGLYLGQDGQQQWHILSKTRGKLQPGEQITLRPPHHRDSTAEFHLTLVTRDSEGGWFVRPESNSDPIELLQQFGTVPLPPLH